MTNIKEARGFLGHKGYVAWMPVAGKLKVIVSMKSHFMGHQNQSAHNCIYEYKIHSMNRYIPQHFQI